METKKRVGALIIQDHKLLLVKGKEYKELWIPGGKIKAEEELECLKRELKEEINTSIKNAKFFGEFSSPSFYSSWNTLNRLYLVEIENNPSPGHEIKEVIWLTKEDFLNKKFPMIPIIENTIIPELISKGYF